MFLSGEVCSTGSDVFRCAYPVGFWTIKPEHPGGCHPDAIELGNSHRTVAARRPVTGAVIGQKSAEAIVARVDTVSESRRAEPGSSGRSRESLALDVEPVRGS